MQRLTLAVWLLVTMFSFRAFGGSIEVDEVDTGKLQITGANGYSLPTAQGTSGQLLQMNTTTDALEWINPSSLSGSLYSANDLVLGASNSILIGSVTAVSYRNNSSIYLGGGGISSTGDYQVAIGAESSRQFSTKADYTTCIGYAAGYDNRSSYATLIGYYSGLSNTGLYPNALGYYAGAYNTGARNTFIGHAAGCNNTGSYGTFMGYYAGYDGAGGGNPYDRTIQIGYKARATNTRQCLIGSNDWDGYITDFYLGSGVTTVSPQPTNIHASGGSGTNVAGSELILFGGESTGTGDGGDIVFKTAKPGTSGATPNSAAERMRLDSNGYLSLKATTAPAAVSGQSFIWSQTDSGTTAMWVKDSTGHATQISPHTFALYQPSPDDPLPWSFYSKNAFIGKRVNADISGALLALEKLTGKKFVYVEDLPASEKVNFDEWRTSETVRLVMEARKQKLAQMPEKEISVADALEEVDETTTQMVQREVSKFRINMQTGQVEQYTRMAPVEETVPTGKKVKQLKNDVRFDENTGKCYRRATLDDVQMTDQEIDSIAASVSIDAMPPYLATRIAKQ